MENKFFGDVFVIILGGFGNVVTNKEPNINVQSNETVGGIANKTIDKLLKLNWFKEDLNENIKTFCFFFFYYSNFANFNVFLLFLYQLLSSNYF